MYITNKMDRQCRTMRIKKNDIVYTPLIVAQRMIEMCDLKKGQTVLDPCYGGGVFYNNLPDYVDKDYCEIEMGKDFFEYDKEVDCVIGNPPYSLWDRWLQHTCEITNKFCYIMGSLNITHRRFKIILDKGYGLVKMEAVSVSWWFANHFILVFEKNKPSILTYFSKNRVKCEICNRRCNRARKGQCFNTCSLLQDNIKKEQVDSDK